MKILNATTHGVVDYAVVLFLLLSPKLFGMMGMAATFTYALGVVHLVLTITTRFPLGLLKIVPFRVHGMVELVVALALVGVAFWFGSAGDGLAKTFYFCFAGAVFLTWLVTDYRSA
ncbi:MAG: hypothetical protein ABI599_00625 [Flavobacteriales bacterium]